MYGLVLADQQRHQLRTDAGCNLSGMMDGERERERERESGNSILLV